MLADVAHEIDHLYVAEPVVVVDYQRWVTAVEVKETLQFAAHVVRPFGDRIAGIQAALFALARRITNQPGAAAD